ncbi:hypothetical protein OROMI_015900 [Orobanche minor]
MAAENPSLMKTKHRRGFMHLLSSAACEWFLIFLLFLNAALSYLLTKFARYCELKSPCLLCSSLHIAFRNKKPVYYWNLLCNNHKDEISCLVSCSIHCKFADVHGMCEECLGPVVNRNKSSSDSYRLLVGKSWLDVDRSVLQNLVLNKHIRLGSPDHRTCSCCSRTWRPKSSTERLLEPNPVGFGASKANVKPPLPRAPGRSRFSRRDSLKRLRDKFTGQITTHSANVDTLSHVGYTKIKISSDSESEFPFSEEDDDRSTNSLVKSSDKHSHLSLIDLSEDKDVSSLSVDGFRQHGLGDLDWQESCKKPNPCLTLDLISFNDGPQQYDVAGGSFGGSIESSKLDVALTHMPAISVLSEFLSLCNIVPSSPNMGAIPKKISVVETNEIADTPVDKNIEAVVGTSSDDTYPLKSSNTHKTDASTQTDETGECEPTNTSDYAKTEENNKSTAQVSISYSGSLSKETSPKSHDRQDKPSTDASTKTLPVSTSLERPDSNCESLDGTTSSDTEGDNITDRLKRQVEHDRNLLNNLYKDLEEERNASAIAANQAMAMITRLQEEKAALHMEALQYLRMMEEQAEYDMEALGRANDLLAEKEKELQDLEIELEFYRNNFLDESGVHNLQSETLTPGNRVSKDNGVCELMDSSLLNIEDEKVYISQCLKKLEKKLRRAYSGVKSDDLLPNGLYPVRSLEDLSPNNGTLLNGENEDDGSIVENVIPLSNENHVHVVSGNDCYHETSGKIVANGGETNSAALEKEIAELHDRLEALEADRDFIKRISDLIRNGKDGLELVREIARQLQELRKMDFKKRRLNSS